MLTRLATLILLLCVIVYAKRDKNDPPADDSGETDQNGAEDPDVDIEDDEPEEPELTPEEIEAQRQAEAERIEAEKQAAVEQCRILSCYVFLPDGTGYDMTPLAKQGGGFADDYFETLVHDEASLEWNFCRYLESSSYFAVRLQRQTATQPSSQILTSDVCTPHAVEPVVVNEEIIGITVVQMSDIECEKDGEPITEVVNGVEQQRKFSFSYTVLCDETITGVGEAIGHSLDGSDWCQPRVSYSHAAGCHKTQEVEVITEVVGEKTETETIIVQKEVEPLSELILSNPVVFGGFLIIISIPLAFFGTVWFKYISGIFGGFGMFIACAFSFQAFDWMHDGSLGFWACIGIAAVVGIIVGLLLWWFVKLGSILIGITLGAVFGVMVWSFINNWMTAKPWMVTIIITSIFAVAGGYLSTKSPNKTIMYGTSLLGSYAFMRGWSLIFKGFAGENVILKKMVHDDMTPLEWQMGIYITLLYLTFTISSFIQFAVGEKKDAMKDFAQEQGTELMDIHNEIKDVPSSPVPDGPDFSGLDKR